MGLFKTLSWVFWSGALTGVGYLLPWAEKRLFFLKLKTGRKSIRHSWYHDQLFARRAVRLLYDNFRRAEKQSLPFSAFVSIAEVYQNEPAHLVIFLVPTATSLKVDVYIRSRQFENRKYKVRNWEIHPWTEE
ncbi:hypothetical protein MOC16_gp133 [Klebsiella phage vB_KpM_FBKp24]|uniref:Uncharacterized protein n=1 Tax=Klebsiella phage vB_KpM_FBKp24 TaxID=2801834 RepID=A0A7U0GBQ7_9CAUD|nr:hypothetical protein [Klebsiella pneumoniae]YP_010298917.1 hypothetical protein MOC16_gp133 [Klebsiella phage vB_KpM_FBKp24]QQV92242.1 hypothetical protein vBKpMFBKp24_280 [Klebsiella phage vB_KpM_FBKp24]